MAGLAGSPVDTYVMSLSWYRFVFSKEHLPYI